MIKNMGTQKIKKEYTIFISKRQKKAVYLFLTVRVNG